MELWCISEQFPVWMGESTQIQTTCLMDWLSPLLQGLLSHYEVPGTYFLDKLLFVFELFLFCLMF